MKIRWTLLLSIFGILTAVANDRTTMSGERPRVAVVLSGGGAKGMAHIGVLKYLQQKGIPIDMVVGTSMGSIIGGLYSIGYSPNEIDTLVRSQDWATLLSDQTARADQTVTDRANAERYQYNLPLGSDLKNSAPQGIVTGRNLDKMFQKLTVGYHHALSFDSLQVPFACVATNAIDGSEYVFRRGILSQAMRASMAIPGAFSPVRMDSMVLIDGGLVNNFPADVAVSMGADIIIGVVFKGEIAKAESLRSMAQILGNIVNLETRKKLSENKQRCDALIEVDPHGLSTASFTTEAVDSLINYGETAAKNNDESLNRVLARFGTAALPPVYPHHGKMDDEKLRVEQIAFEGVDSTEQVRIRKRCKLKVPCSLHFEDIESIEREMTDEMAYTTATYMLSELPSDADTLAPQKYQLKFFVSDKQKMMVRVGARLNNEEIASLLLQAQYRFRGGITQNVALTARLGKRSYGEVGYQLEVSRCRMLNASYRLEYNDINVYNHGSRNYNVVYNLHKAGVSFQDYLLTNFRYELFSDFSYYHYRDILTGVPVMEAPASGHLFNYGVKLDYDSYDKAFFPQKGARFFAEYGMHTDNLYQYKGKAPFHSATYFYEIVVPLSKNNLRLMPQLSGRHLFGHSYAYGLSNFLGGMDRSGYFEQQLPFPGINNVELVRPHNMNLTLRLRERFGSKNFVWLAGGVGTLSKDFESLLSSRYIWGTELGYGYDSILGPLRFTLGYSGYSKKFNMCINLGMRF